MPTETLEASRVAAALRNAAEKHAQPDPNTLATIPKGGANLSYMGHAEVTLALIDIDPLWSWRPLATDPATGGPLVVERGRRLVMWGELTVCGVTRIAVGTCEANKGEPEKELVGDLLRNGAMRFGVGTKLWSKATEAEPTSKVSGGGYEQTFSAAAMTLFRQAKAAPAEVKERIRVLAAENHTTVSAGSFDDDPRWAELVRAELEDKSARLDAAHDAGHV